MIKETKYQKIQYDPFRSGLIEKAIPATLSQREMWATLILEPEANICYNEVICMEVKGNISEDRLNSAFQEVLRRHEALRATFSSDGKYFIVHQYQYSPLKIQSIEERELIVHQEEEVTIPFDLINGPLSRLKLLKVSNSKSYILFSAHHIVCDGWSLAIILTELTRAYESMSLGPVSSFVQFALQENKNGISTRDKNYWLDIFKEPFAGNKLPLDFPRPKYRTYESERIDLDVSSELVSKFKKFSAKNRISFYNLLMGGFSLLLNKLTSQNDVVVGMATAAQSIPGNEEVVGHLVNMLPIRSQLKIDENIKDYLVRLKKVMMDGIDHQCYTFGSLLADLNIPRNPGEIPIINVVFNIDQQLTNQGLEFSELKASYQSVPRIKENFEIFINAVSRDNELTIECQYNKNLLQASTIKNWLENYVRLLDIVTSSEISIGQIKLPELYVPQAKVVATEEKTKVDRNELVEGKLTQIWKELLKKEITPEDNFFAKGGHSLLVVEMIQKIEKEFNKKVSVREVFENPTVIELAGIVHQHESQKIEKIIPVKKSEHYVVSPAQLQVWYLEEIFKSTPMHNLPSSIDLQFKVDAKLLEEALNVLIERHDSLKSTIKVVEGLPVTVVHQNRPRFVLEVVDVKQSDVQQVLNDLASDVIEKESLFLFRAKLLRVSSEHFVFFFMPHHMIWDGWSFDIFFEELNTAYTALLKQTEIKFRSEVLLTYQDYAHWLNKQLNESILEGERRYWVEKLKLPLPRMDLVTKARPDKMNHEGRTFSFNLEKEIIEKLQNYCLDNSVSLYNVFLTAFKVTLARHSKLNDIIVGTPVRCRNFPELLNIIGYFVNTVALRTQIDPGASFRTNLKEVMATSIEAFDHAQLPYQEVMKSVKFPRDPSRTPIYQTFFSYQDVSNRLPELAGHPYQQINIEKNSTHTDLDLWIKAGTKKIEGAFEYRADLIDSSWMEDFYSSFINTLEDVFKTETPLIKETTTFKELSSNNVVSLFEVRVKENPNKVAIQTESERLSYSELNERANAYACALKEQGLGAGQFVGIALSRHAQLVPALLGILKTGAAYVPLDPSFPQDRLDYMIENSQIKYLITEKKHAGRFPHLKQVLVEGISDLNSSLNISNDIDGNSSAYVIYTSGSTGKPKGVEISHGSLINFLLSMAETPGMKSSDRLLAVTTLSFDIAGLELFLPLISGASIYLANQFDVIDGEALRNIVEKHSINYMQATPSTWRLLLAAGWKGDPSFTLLCGGEAFPKDLAYKLIPMVGAVWNMYGPTETTIWSTCKKLSLSDTSITVGNAIANTTLYILDENKNILRIEEEGELYIGGIGVAKGYYNRPDLTSERFINHPQLSGERIYATGDLAKINQHGELEVLGRLDGQVKVRGYRIELGEIEAQINMMNGVEVSAAITKEVAPGDARIIAFVVLQDKGSLAEEDLKNHLQKTLPKYMIPTHFVFIEQMPQTLNGKIDKKTLGQMFGVEEVSTPVALPVSEHSSGIEEMRDIWKRVLAVSEISDDANFFDIGGNSLLAVELSNKVAKHFGVSFQLRSLLERPSFLDFTQSYIKINLKKSEDLTNTKYLVTIRKQGNLSPLFFIHPVGGNVLNYTQLLPAIENRPVYGIQSAGLIADDHPGTIEGMAALYIEEMKLVQPQGPYLLAGGSMGGSIAFEIAQQLKQRGDEVERLILFDTFGPDFDLTKYENEEVSFWKNFQEMFKYHQKIILFYLKGLILNFLGAELPLEMKLFAVEVKNYQAIYQYRPKKYKGDIHLIRNELREKGWYSDPYLGWKEIVQGKIHVSYIKAPHSEFIESRELLDALKKMI